VSDPRVRASPQAVLLVLGGIVSVQLGAVVAKQIFPAVGPAGAVFLRLGVGAVILGIVARPTRADVHGHLRLALAFGAVLATMNLSFYAALTRIPLGAAVTIEFLGPLLLAVAMSRRRRDMVWALVAGAGVAALSWEGGGVGLDLAGAGLAAIAGVCWAGYILLSQRLGAAVPGLTGLAVAVAAGALVAAVPGIAQGGARLLEPRTLTLGIGVGVLSSAVPYALEFLALRRLAAGTFGILMSLEPAVAALAGLVLLDEGLRVLQVLGVALVCLASAAVTAGRPPEP
jgi:inner membrane transporter RhtA